MKQVDLVRRQEGEKLLRAFEELRGAPALEFQKRMSNDPALLHAFTDNYKNCTRTENAMPRKYRELIMMALGCATGTHTTILTHGHLAFENGASVEEVGEALRIVLFMCGTTAVIPAMELFDLPEKDEEKKNEI